MTTSKKRHRLFVDQLDTVGLVDKGDDPEARIVFLKREEDVDKKQTVRPPPGAGQNEKLEEALRELRDLADKFFYDRQNVAGNIVRDVAIARVLAANTELHARLESLASKDWLHKAAAVRSDVEGRMSMDSTVAELSKALGGDDRKLGLRLVARHFPRLHSRWQGTAFLP